MKSNETICYLLREPYVNKLRYNIGTYDWSQLFCGVYDDIDSLYSNFLHVVKSLIDISIPSKIVVISPRDPDFVTPPVKVLLNKRNRLRRQGKTEEANDIANKINEMIVSIRRDSATYHAPL